MTRCKRNQVPVEYRINIKEEIINGLMMAACSVVATLGFVLMIVA